MTIGTFINEGWTLEGKYCCKKKQYTLQLFLRSREKFVSFAIVLMQLCLPKNNKTTTNQMPNHYLYNNALDKIK
jgi:hypothetical protein